MFARFGLASLALLAACGSRPVLLEDPNAGKHELRFHNEVGIDICAVHIFREFEGQEGANWLTGGRVVESGASAMFWVPPATYQVRAYGCPYEKLHVIGYTPQVPVSAEAHVVLYRDDVPQSAQVATALAHERENTTKMLAKLRVNKSPSPRPPPAADAATAAPAQPARPGTTP